MKEKKNGLTHLVVTKIQNNSKITGFGTNLFPKFLYLYFFFDTVKGFVLSANLSAIHTISKLKY